MDDLFNVMNEEIENFFSSADELIEKYNKKAQEENK